MSTLDEVVAALQAAQKRVEDAIARSGRARREAANAAAKMRHAVQGSSHPDAHAAIQRWSAAVDRLDRMIPRLIIGNDALDAYIDHIAPGRPQRGGVAFPSGEELVDEAEHRDRSLGALIRVALRKADDVQDVGSNVATIVHRAFHMTIRPKAGGALTLGPPASQSAGTQQAEHVKLDPADIVGNSIVAAVGVAAVSYQTVETARKAFRRRKRGK